jgi:hypothetical protein
MARGKGREYTAKSTHVEATMEGRKGWRQCDTSPQQQVHRAYKSDGIKFNQSSRTGIVVACLSNSAADTISRHSSTSPFTLPFCDRVDILCVLLRGTGCDEWTSLVWTVREVLSGKCSKDSMQAEFKHQIVRFSIQLDRKLNFLMPINLRRRESEPSSHARTQFTQQSHKQTH